MNSTISRIAVLCLVAFAGAAQAGVIHGKSHGSSHGSRYDTQRGVDFRHHDTRRHAFDSEKFREQVRRRHGDKIFRKQKGVADYPTEVPEPTAIALVAAGLASLVMLRRPKARN